MKFGPLVLAAVLAVLLVVRRDHTSTAMRWGVVVGCAGLVAYGSGLIHPPPLEVMVRDGTRALGPYTYALVGALAYLETGAFVGLIAPGELVVMLGGVSAGQGEIQLIPLIILVWACALAGDLTSYALGRRLGREFLVRHGSMFAITEARLGQVERFFAAHGGKTIILGRFIGLVRALAPFIAGASRMPVRRFVPYTTIAAGLWATLFCLLGYAFWHSFGELMQIARQGTLGFGIAVGVIVGTVALYRQVQQRRSQRTASASASE